jgi:hypothetical protein
MNPDVIKELTAIEEQLAAAWVNGDHVFIERVLSDDWSVIDPTGRILTKSEVLKEAFTGEREITEGQVDQINVRDLGDAAVVTGRTRMSGRYQGAEMTGSSPIHGCVCPNLARMEVHRLTGHIHNLITCSRPADKP